MVQTRSQVRKSAQPLLPMHVSLSSDDNHTSQGFSCDDSSSPNSSRHHHQLPHLSEHQVPQPHSQGPCPAAPRCSSSTPPGPSAAHPGGPCPAAPRCSSSTPPGPSAAHPAPKAHDRCCIVRHSLFAFVTSWPIFQQCWFSKATVSITRISYDSIRAKEYTLFVHAFI
ncbi:hypothetical protein V6N13_061956 [Hibiscus sabdariffa]|uniref:Uncharacterized protein n=1 Tax=Hibiscus sabdariffa TaxID=183260 RepID=A0ABR2PF12_9ROSI